MSQPVTDWLKAPPQCPATASDGRACLLGIRHSGAHAWEGYEVDALRAALERIRDHGKTHEEPCWALHKGDCADAMQEIARAALADSCQGKEKTR